MDHYFNSPSSIGGSRYRPDHKYWEKYLDINEYDEQDDYYEDVNLHAGFLWYACQNIRKRLDTIRDENGSWPEDMPQIWTKKYNMCSDMNKNVSPPSSRAGYDY